MIMLITMPLTMTIVRIHNNNCNNGNNSSNGNMSPTMNPVGEARKS